MLRADHLAVQPLLQIGERRDLAIAHHQQLAIEHRVEIHRLEDFRKRAGNVLGAARIEPPAAFGRDELHADAVPFPFGAPVRRAACRRCRRPPADAPASADGTPAPAPGRAAARASPARRTAPDTAAPGRATPPPHHRPRRRRSRPARSSPAAPRRRRASPPVISFSSASRTDASRRIQPAGDDARQRRLGRGLQRLHHLGQTRRRRIGGRGRPHQRDGLGQIADIVVRPREQHRIGARRGKFADQARLGGGERQLAGDRRQADAAIRVRLRREIAPQQRDLGVARRREHQALQQFGEGDHGDRMLARHAHYANVARICTGCYGDIDAPPPAPRFARHDAAACRARRVRYDTIQESEPSRLRRRRIQERPGAVPQTELQGRHKGGLRRQARRSRWTKTRRGPA